MLLKNDFIIWFYIIKIVRLHSLKLSNSNYLNIENKKINEIVYISIINNKKMYF